MQSWFEFILSLEPEIGKDAVDKWLRTLKVEKFDACNLYLKAKDDFQIIWFEEHVRKKALAKLVNNNARQIKVHLFVEKKETPLKSFSFSENKSSLFAVENEKLQSLYTFENFLLAKENTFSLQVLSEVVGYDCAKGSYLSNYLYEAKDNPLFLQGPSASGKTHLLHALAHGFKKRGLKVCFLEASQFTEYLVKAIKSSQMNLFRAECRNADALLIDNIEVFACKNATQEEFFHTFNHYHTQNKPIILTSALSPKDMKEIEPRLISRFEWGLHLSLKTLPEEQMLMLLLKKIKLLDLSLTLEVQKHLIENLTDAKSLCLALETLHLKRYIDPKSAFSFKDLSYVHKLILPLIESSCANKITPDDILCAICERFDQKKEDLLGKSQSHEKVVPRKIAMYFLRKNLHLSYVKIGKIFSKDHSTVMASVESVETAIENKTPAFIENIDAIKKAFIKTKT